MHHSRVSSSPYSNHSNLCSFETIRSTKMDLLDFSDEILLEIFTNFNDIDLLCAAEVCKRFKELTKEIITKKYNGDSDDKYYELKWFADGSSDVQEIFRKFLETFSNQMTALCFLSESRTNKQKLLKLINRHCRVAKYVIIQTTNGDEYPITKTIHAMRDLTNLTLKNLTCTDFFWADQRFPHLISLHLDEVKKIDVQVLKRFIYINTQLKHLRVTDCPNFPLKVIQALRNHLNRLKSLVYIGSNSDFPNKCHDLKVENLESLKITVNRTSTAKVLSAIGKGSKMITSLDVCLQGDDEMSIDETY